MTPQSAACWPPGALPNPIGITVTEILTIYENKIRVTGLDALNETPILDIKPYEEHFDSPMGIERSGIWRISPRMIHADFISPSSKHAIS